MGGGGGEGVVEGVGGGAPGHCSPPGGPAPRVHARSTFSPSLAWSGGQVSCSACSEVQCSVEDLLVENF